MRENSKVAVVSVGIGGWYPQGIERLRAHLDRTGFTGTFKAWDESYPHGWPLHNSVPYGFKVFAMQWAKTNGFDIVIWMDSSVWPQHSIQPLIDHIERTGYLVFRNGNWTSGQWTTQAQLEAFGYTREEAMRLPHGVGGVIGIDFRHEQGQRLFNDYSHVNLFKGSWTNENNQVSHDPRVLGSRHDQSVLSLAVCRNSMEFTPPDGMFSVDMNDTDSILLAQGM